jgi:hypothetical protein
VSFGDLVVHVFPVHDLVRFVPRQPALGGHPVRPGQLLGENLLLIDITKRPVRITRQVVPIATCELGQCSSPSSAWRDDRQKVRLHRKSLTDGTASHRRRRILCRRTPPDHLALCDQRPWSRLRGTCCQVSTTRLGARADAATAAPIIRPRIDRRTPARSPPIRRNMARWCSHVTGLGRAGSWSIRAFLSTFPTGVIGSRSTAITSSGAL